MQFLPFFLFLLILPVNSFSQEISVDDYLDTAVIFKESAEYEKADSILEKALSFRADDKLLKLSARIKFLKGEASEAASLFKSVNKQDWQSYLFLGLACEDLGREFEAIDNYLESLKLQPNTIAFFRLGKIYRNRENYNKAIDVFTRLIRLDPSVRLAYYYLGECLYRNKKHKQAYKFLSKARNFYPGIKEIKELLSAAGKALGEDFFTAGKIKKEEARKNVKFKKYKPQIGIPEVRIGIGQSLNEFSFLCGAGFIVSDSKSSFKGQPNRLYTIVLKGQRIILRDYKEKSSYGLFSTPLKISSPNPQEKSPFYVLDVVYGQKDFWHKKIDRAYRGDLEVIIKNKGLNLVNSLSVEEYLYGVLSAEISAKAKPAALRAQAVAARTIAFKNLGRHKKNGFDFCADVHCQVYQGVSAETLSTTKAVVDTEGEAIVYSDEFIETFYHSNCGGCLSADTFGDNNYLVSKIDSIEGSLPKSPYDEEAWFFNAPKTFCAYDGKGKARWQRVYDEEDFALIFGFNIKDIKSISPLKKGDCFHYKEIELITSKEKRILKGDLEIRNYFDKLKSSAFKVDIKLSAKSKPNMLFFWGAGFGHGAGLCQEGAMAMANQGYTYKEILKHYYPATKIKKAF